MASTSTDFQLSAYLEVVEDLRQEDAYNSASIELKYCMRYMWPEPLHAQRNMLNLSGLDCATIVLRQILSFLPRAEREKDLVKEAKIKVAAQLGSKPMSSELNRSFLVTEALLTYAWHYLPVLSRYTSEELKGDVLQRQIRLLRTLSDAGALTRPSLGFRDLMESKSMWNALWSLKQYRFYSGQSFVKDNTNPASEWRETETKIKVPRYHLFHWDPSEHQDLSELFSCRLREATSTDDRTTTVDITNWPEVIRVTIAVPMTIDQVPQKFQLTGYDGRPWEINDTGSYDNSRITKEYIVKTAIGCAPSPEDCDLVHVFNKQGAEIQANFDVSLAKKTYNPAEWHQGRDYDSEKTAPYIGHRLSNPGPLPSRRFIVYYIRNRLLSQDFWQPTRGTNITLGLISNTWKTSCPQPSATTLVQYDLEEPRAKVIVDPFQGIVVPTTLDSRENSVGEGSEEGQIAE